MDTQNDLNIPNINVTQAVKELAGLYTSAIRVHMPLKSLPSAFLWGPAGIGKSQGVYELASLLAASTGMKTVVTDVRLLLFSPVDLRGVPVADSSRQFSDWLMPRIFDMSAADNVINLLFLDELSAAPQSVQAAAYQICLDRRIGEHRLPDNCLVIAAGNRTTDQCCAFKMPKALCNRLQHFNIVCDFESWRAWAVKSGIDGRIVGYLSFAQDHLNRTPEPSELAYPTPRSWEFVSNILKATGGEPAGVRHLLCGCVGNDTALEFETWCKVYPYLPKIDDIFAARCKTYPKKNDILFALVSSLTAAVRERCPGISEREFENVCTYAAGFPPDFAMSFFKDMQEIKSLGPALTKSRALGQWLAKHKDIL